MYISFSKKNTTFAIGILLLVFSVVVISKLHKKQPYSLPGFIYTGSINLNDFEAHFPKSQPRFIIFDATGRIVSEKKSSSSVFAHQNTPLDSITYTLHDSSNPRWAGTIFRNKNNNVASLRVKDNPHTDIHGPLHTSRNTWVLPSYKLHIINGKKIESFYLEEQDLEGKVLWSWDSLDHVPASHSRTKETRKWWLENKIDDYFHGNSIQETNDGNYLISGRNTNQLLKVDRQTGLVLWTFGGVDSDFTFINDPLYGFAHQHSAHELLNGNILVYDNGNTRETPLSRAVEYQLNYTDMTAELVWSYSDGRFTPATGSVQRLPDGNTLIGWGVSIEPNNTKIPRISIVNPDRILVHEIFLEHNENIYSAHYSPFLHTAHLSN